MKCRNITFECRERYAARWKEGNADEKDDSRYDRKRARAISAPRSFDKLLHSSTWTQSRPRCMTLFRTIRSYTRYFLSLPVCILQEEEMGVTVFTCPIARYISKISIIILIHSYTYFHCSGVLLFFFPFARGKKDNCSYLEEYIVDNNRMLLFRAKYRTVALIFSFPVSI